MKMDELMQKVLEILPNAVFEEEIDGEVTISTRMTQDSKGDLVDIEED